MSIEDVDAVLEEIDALPADAQSRVHAIADMLRGSLQCDERSETELAMSLVITELNEEDDNASPNQDMEVVGMDPWPHMRRVLS